MSEEKFDVYREVTKKIVASLEQGVIPWRQRWASPMIDRINYISRKKYNGINSLLLQDKGEYLTYKQCTDCGGIVKRGEKAKYVFQHFEIPAKEDKEEYDRLKKEKKDTSHLKTFWLLRQIPVFHISQTFGIESKMKENQYQMSGSPTDLADLVIDFFSREKGITVKENEGDVNGYDEGSRELVVPLREQFTNEELWYTNIFSQLVRITLTADKNKDKDGVNESSLEKKSIKDIAKDELQAEIGACMVMTAVGLNVELSNKDTIEACSYWANKCNNDYRLVVRAANGAQRAADVLLKPLFG